MSNEYAHDDSINPIIKQSIRLAVQQNHQSTHYSNKKMRAIRDQNESILPMNFIGNIIDGHILHMQLHVLVSLTTNG